MRAVVSHYDASWSVLWFFDGQQHGYLNPGVKDFGLNTGDRIVIRGQTKPGTSELEPSTLEIDVVGPGEPPTATLMGSADAFDPALNNKRVLMEGIPFGVNTLDDTHLAFFLRAFDRNISVVVKHSPGESIPLLEETFVRVTGALTLHPEEQIIPVVAGLLTSGLDQITVLQQDLGAFFEGALTQIDQIIDREPGTRVVFKGVVEALPSQFEMVVKDDSGNLTIPHWQRVSPEVGSVVEVSGTVGEAGGLERTLLRPILSFDDQRDIPGPNFSTLPELRLLPADSRFRTRGIVSYSMIDGEKESFVVQDGLTAFRFQIGERFRSVELDSWVEFVGNITRRGNELVYRANELLRTSSSTVPRATAYSFGQARAGLQDYLWVDLVGVVMEVETDDRGYDAILLQTSEGMVKAGGLRLFEGRSEANSWLENRVHITGVCLPLEGLQGRQIGHEIRLRSIEDMILLEPAIDNRFDASTKTIEEIPLLPVVDYGRRFVVEGWITHVFDGEFFFLSDGVATLLVELEKGDRSLTVGDRKQVSGIVSVDFSDCVLRRSSARTLPSAPGPKPEKVDEASMFGSDLVGHRVLVEGAIVSVKESWRQCLLSLDSGLISARFFFDDPEQLLPGKGARIRLEGTYLESVDPYGIGSEGALVVTEPSMITVTQSAPLLTPFQLGFIASVASAVAAAGLFGAFYLRRRVDSQTETIRSQLARVSELSRRHEDLFRHAADLIFTCDIKGCITSFNPAGEVLTGFLEREVKGLSVREVFPGDVSHWINAKLDATRSERRSEAFMLPLVRKDGGLRWFEISGRQFLNQDRQIELICIGRDMDDRKTIEDNLRKSKEEAEETSKLKSFFLANVSHELRTPMNGIIGMTDLLIQTPLNERQRRYTEVIRSSGETLMRLVTDLLDFSSSQNRTLKLDCCEFSLRDLVERAAELGGTSANLEGLAVCSYVSLDLVDNRIGDPVRIMQILQNLLNNAVKFTEKGYLKLTAQRCAGAEMGVRFEVEDTGIGIAESDLAKVFKPFNQGDNSGRRIHGGAGLGLSIVSELVEAMGGKAGMDSQLGRGTTVWVELPLEVAGEPRFSLKAEVPTSDLMACVIEGEPAFRSVVQAYLQDMGVEERAFETRDDALSFLGSLSERQKIVFVFYSESAGIDNLHDYLAERVALDQLKQYQGVRLSDGLSHRMALPDESSVGVLKAPFKLKSLVEILSPDRVAFDEQRHPETAIPEGFQGSLENVANKEKRYRVLVAEDNRANQMVIESQLENLGYLPELFSNGQALLNRLDEGPYDLILMDCQMPLMDGFETTRRIRESDQHGHAKIVALTASATPDDRQACLEAGMNDFVSKPVKVRDIKAVVARLLTEGRDN